MVQPAVGGVVLVRFPFSDLSATKLRPAVVLAEVDRDDWICAQITSNPYSDIHAVELTDADFASGSLHRTSYVRPGKLFCTNASIMERQIGELHSEKMDAIIEAVVKILHPTP